MRGSGLALATGITPGGETGAEDRSSATWWSRHLGVGVSGDELLPWGGPVLAPGSWSLGGKNKRWHFFFLPTFEEEGPQSRRARGSRRLQAEASSPGFGSTRQVKAARDARRPLGGAGRPPALVRAPRPSPASVLSAMGTRTLRSGRPHPIPGARASGRSPLGRRTRRRDPHPLRRPSICSGVGGRAGPGAGGHPWPPPPPLGEAGCPGKDSGTPVFSTPLTPLGRPAGESVGGGECGLLQEVMGGREAWLGAVREWGAGGP